MSSTPLCSSIKEARDAARFGLGICCPCLPPRQRDTDTGRGTPTRRVIDGDLPMTRRWASRWALNPDVHGTGTLTGPRAQKGERRRGQQLWLAFLEGGGWLETQDHNLGTASRPPPPRWKLPRYFLFLAMRLPSSPGTPHLNPVHSNIIGCKERALSPLREPQNARQPGTSASSPATTNHTKLAQHLHIKLHSISSSSPSSPPKSDHIAQGPYPPPPLEPSQSSLRPPFHWPGSKCWQKSLPSR